ncbi:MAG: hypothetical protein GF313_06215 [Caldithrix sp.]|nr:hypothetical protein [Caldithrix sp.]
MVGSFERGTKAPKGDLLLLADHQTIIYRPDVFTLKIGNATGHERKPPWPMWIYACIIFGKYSKGTPAAMTTRRRGIFEEWIIVP